MAQLAQIAQATPKDAETLLTLQKMAYRSEAERYNDWSIPPLTQTIASLDDDFSKGVVLKATVGERIVGSVRARIAGDICAIGRLFVDPEFQGKGIGTLLLRSAERSCAGSESRSGDGGPCKGVAKFELFTGSESERNIRLYLRAGYRVARTQALSPQVSLTFLEKSAADDR